ncbi:MAG: EamA family transporter [Thermodesulfobacteriota bacterium]|nr:EamA family transporter [Thermodesulfobacteriota bacterium]
MKITDVCLAILVAFLWGFNFVVIEIGLDSFPPILFSALRFSCAAFPAVLLWGKGDIEWRWIISIGVTLGIVMFSLLFIGMKLCGNIDMFRLVIWMSIIPPIPLFLISLVFETDHTNALSSISLAGSGSILYTGLISTVLAFAIWGRLLREYSPNVVAPFSLLVPVFGIVSSFIVLEEKFTHIELISSCIVFGGLSLVVFGSKLTVFLRNNAYYIYRK